MFWNEFGKYIVRLFRKNPSQESLRCGHDITFAEFVKYIIHSQRTGMNRNGHFVPTHDHCYWCRREYQYIGHLETINEDMPFILKAIKSHINYTKDFDKLTIEGNAQMVFNHFISGVLRCMTLEDASRRLWKKWQVRGIISKTEQFPLKLEQTDNITVELFKDVAMEALSRSRNKPEIKEQKKEALREAFSSVPFLDVLKLQKLLSLDFEMFGFDSSPLEIFGETSDLDDSGFSYFKIH
nr:hypothetical protein BaRGS_012171 [Batillaria attramentaria]